MASSYFQTVQSGQSTSMYAQTKATDALVEQLAPIINSPFAKGYAIVSPASGENIPTNPIGSGLASAGYGASSFNGIDAMTKYYNGGTYNNSAGTFANGFYIFASTRDSEAAPTFPRHSP